MTPLVTIGIPLYNCAQWLQAAIGSALAQTWEFREVIVVDDGSTDSSLLLASAYGDRITLLRTPHRGANFARNLILKEAAGEWIQYLDADDYLLPNKVATQFEETDQGKNADVIYSPVWVEETKADIIRRTTSDLDPKKDLFQLWLGWDLPQTGGALWRKQALADLGGWRTDQPCCQEHELYDRALKAGLRFQFAPTPGAGYRIWSDHTICRKDPRMVARERTKLIDGMRQWMEAKKLWKPTHQAIASLACFEMARTLARFDRTEAARYYRERKERGLIEPGGPTAPTFYRAALRMLGFSGAECLSRLLRK